MEGKIDFIKYCKVISVIDNDGTDRILVEVKPEDNSVDLKENISKTDAHKNFAEPKTLYAFPLLPKAFRILPKEGEGVFVLFASSETNTQRYYIGPVISQDDKLWNNSFEEASSFMPGTYYPITTNKKQDKELTGVFPQDTEIAVRGRKNADVIISDDEVKIRSGVKLCPKGDETNIKYNHEDPAFIKVKYHPEQIEVKKIEDEENQSINEQINSTVTVVADKINLFGHKSNSPELTKEHIDGVGIVEDDKLTELMDKAHKLPYGDKLIEILEEIILVLKKHTHKFPMEPPLEYWFKDGSSLNEKEEILLKQKQLLSDTVLIN
jgi:hypothetical protein